MRAHVVAHQCQTQPGARRLDARLGVDVPREKRSKTASRSSGGTPGPASLTASRTASPARSTTTDATPSPCTLRVLHEVGDHPSASGGESACTRVSPRRVSTSVRPLVSSTSAVMSARSTTGEVARLERLVVAGEVEQVLEQLGEPGDVDDEQVDRLLGDMRQLGAPRLEHRGARRHRRQGAAQLVADVGGELRVAPDPRRPTSRPSR